MIGKSTHQQNACVCVCIYILTRNTKTAWLCKSTIIFKKKKIERVEIRITPCLCMSLLNVASIYPREGNENIQTYFYTWNWWKNEWKVQWILSRALSKFQSSATQHHTDWYIGIHCSFSDTSITTMSTMHSWIIISN
jgi:hypothetical protein